jgi:hypothetical protein
VWVTNESDQELLQIDPASLEEEDKLHLDNQPASVAVGEGAVWVTITDDGTVARIEP